MNVNEGVLSTFKEIFQTALISLAIFLFVYIFLVQPHRVKGESMSPNFEDGELLLTEKVSYRFGNPKRGDVIVFEAPVGNKVDFIKRIIGTPGDTVAVKNGEVSVNNSRLNEPYIKVETQGDEVRKLGADDYFVLGDNRGASSDSRVFGPIKKSVIRGRVWFVYWPILKTAVYRGLRLISGVNY
jgi:signal peptidase I